MDAQRDGVACLGNRRHPAPPGNAQQFGQSASAGSHTTQCLAAGGRRRLDRGTSDRTRWSEEQESSPGERRSQKPAMPSTTQPSAERISAPCHHPRRPCLRPVPRRSPVYSPLSPHTSWTAALSRPGRRGAATWRGHRLTPGCPPAVFLLTSPLLNQGAVTGSGRHAVLVMLLLLGPIGLMMSLLVTGLACMVVWRAHSWRAVAGAGAPGSPSDAPRSAMELPVVRWGLWLTAGMLVGDHLSLGYALSGNWMTASDTSVRNLAVLLMYRLLLAVVLVAAFRWAADLADLWWPSGRTGRLTRAVALVVGAGPTDSAHRRPRLAGSRDQSRQRRLLRDPHLDRPGRNRRRHRHRHRHRADSARLRRLATHPAPAVNPLPPTPPWAAGALLAMIPLALALGTYLFLAVVLAG